MCQFLLMAGADVMGDALEPPTSPNLFQLCELEQSVNSIVGDVRDLENMKKVFAADRIIPDCIRATEKKEDIIVRNPYSIRPYEHVLETIASYLMIAKATGNLGKWVNRYDGGPHKANIISHYLFNVCSLTKKHA